MRRVDRSPLISAAEIGDFVYCAKAWYLKRCGAIPQSPRLDQGATFHKKHGTTVLQAARLRRIGAVLSLIGLFLIIALAMIRFAN